MADKIKASYAKLKDDSWGIKIKGGEVEAGDSVMVTTKDGRVNHEVVDRVLWTGENDGQPAQLCTVVRVKEEASERSASPEKTGKCIHCGKPIKPQYTTCFDCRPSTPARSKSPF